MKLSPPGTHFAAESTEAMRIKYLAQGNNILLLGFEPSTSVTRNRHSNQTTNMLISYLCDNLRRVYNILIGQRERKRHLRIVLYPVFDSMFYSINVSQSRSMLALF